MCLIKLCKSKAKNCENDLEMGMLNSKQRVCCMFTFHLLCRKDSCQRPSGGGCMVHRQIRDSTASSLSINSITSHLEGPPRLVASLYQTLSGHREKSNFYKGRHFYKGVSQGQISKGKDQGQKQRHKQDPSFSGSSPTQQAFMPLQNIHLHLSDFQINFTVIAAFYAIPGLGTSFQAGLNNTS